MGFRTNTNVTTEVMFQEMREFLTTAAGLTSIGYSAVGTGLLTDTSALGTVVEETYQLEAQSAGTSASFSVLGGVTGAHPNATAGVPYTLGDGTLSFTISNGTTAWNIGDIITFEAKRFMGEDPVWDTPNQGPNEETISSFISSRGLTYVAANNDYKVVEGRYPDTKGVLVSTNHARASRNDLSNFASQYPEMADGNGYPRQFSITWWGHEEAAGFHYNWTGTPHYRRVKDSRQLETRDYNVSFVFFRGLTEAGLGKQGLTVCSCAAGWNVPSFYNYSGARAIYDNSMVGHKTVYEARLSSIAYPWNLYTVSVNAVGNDMDFFINGVYAGGGSSGKIPNKWPNIYELGDVNNASKGQIFDELVMWDGFLDATLCTELYNRTTSVQAATTLGGGAVAVWEKVTDVVNSDVGGGYFSNIADNEHQVNLLLTSTAQSLQFSSALGVTDTVGSDDEHYQITYTNGWTPKLAAYYLASSVANYAAPELPSTKVVSHLLRGIQELVSAYWIIADNSRMIIVTKYYDPSTSRKTPLYQVSYIGQLEGVGDLGPFTCIAGMYTGDLDWVSNSANLRFGGMFMTNFQAYGWEDGWHSTYTTYYGTNHGTTYPYDNYYVAWDIILGTSGTGDSANNYGRFKGMVSLPINDVNAGDLINIKGEDYIVIQDGNRTDDASMIGIKLK